MCVLIPPARSLPNNWAFHTASSLCAFPATPPPTLPNTWVFHTASSLCAFPATPPPTLPNTWVFHTATNLCVCYRLPALFPTPGLSAQHPTFVFVLTLTPSLFPATPGFSTQHSTYVCYPPPPPPSSQHLDFPHSIQPMCVLPPPFFPTPGFSTQHPTCVCYPPPPPFPTTGFSTQHPTYVCVAPSLSPPLFNQLHPLFSTPGFPRQVVTQSISWGVYVDRTSQLPALASDTTRP